MGTIEVPSRWCPSSLLKVMIDSPKKIRTRFAPSPTGFVHIGNFRTALFAYLYAKNQGGSFVLRVEDTDQNRKVEGAVEVLLQTMKVMGVEADEGYCLLENGEIGELGKFGPYLQSQRLHIYKKHIQELVDKGAAYYCFCSEQRLEELRKEQTALKKPPMYDRHCRNLSVEEVKNKLEEFAASNTNPVVRFAMPLEGTTIIHDLIFGDVEYDNKVLDDQVILKSDGFPTYHLAVVVDDHYMQITHVIRGDEWIPSTPKHLLLYKAFGWEPTAFAHAPLILNPDKTKLSKRQGDVAVEDYLKKGYLPEALINFVVFLGWNPKTEQEIFSLEELVKEFELSKVNKSPAVFDVNKLDWLNGQYIRQMTVLELSSKLVPFWKEYGINTESFSLEYLQAITKLEQERLKKLSEIGERTAYFFSEPEIDASLLVWKNSTLEKTKQILLELAELIQNLSDEKFSVTDLEEVIKKYIAQKGYDNGSVLWPLRYALTGQKASPGPFEVASVLILGLGKEAVVNRLKAAAGKI